MSFCSLTKRITPKICTLCVYVIINKRSFESFMCLFPSWPHSFNTCSWCAAATPTPTRPIPNQCKTFQSRNQSNSLNGKSISMGWKNWGYNQCTRRKTLPWEIKVLQTLTSVFLHLWYTSHCALINLSNNQHSIDSEHSIDSQHSISTRNTRSTRNTLSTRNTQYRLTVKAGKHNLQSAF